MRRRAASVVSSSVTDQSPRPTLPRRRSPRNGLDEACALGPDWQGEAGERERKMSLTEQVLTADAAALEVFGRVRRFSAEYAAPDELLVPRLLRETAQDEAAERRIAARARRYVEGIRR